jgi:hypothetical protein
MSEAKHTPGPWQREVGAGRGAWIMGPTKEWAALACGDTDRRAEANARLIAAAPDMLAALKQVEAEMRAGFGSSFGETREQVRRAIAKAEGTQP